MADLVTDVCDVFLNSLLLRSGHDYVWPPESELPIFQIPIKDCDLMVIQSYARPSRFGISGEHYRFTCIDGAWIDPATWIKRSIRALPRVVDVKVFMAEGGNSIVRAIIVHIDSDEPIDAAHIVDLVRTKLDAREIFFCPILVRGSGTYGDVDEAVWRLTFVGRESSS